MPSRGCTTTSVVTKSMNDSGSPTVHCRSDRMISLICCRNPSLELW